MKRVFFTIIISVLIISCNNSLKKNIPQQQNDLVPESSNYHDDTTKIKQIEYALIVSNRDSVCLYDTYELGKTVTIINFDSGLLFETSTYAYTKYESEFESKVLTRIKDQPSKLITGESIAFFGEKPSDFILFETEKINNYLLSKSIDSLIRKSSLIDSLLLHNKCSEGNEYYSLKGVMPSLTGLRYQNNRIILATYEMFEGVPGPRLAVFNENKVVPLTGQCSFEFLSYYSMNGKYYIYTGSGGCECGINAIEIFEIKPDTIVRIFQDYSFSN
jgi:hypothetical protein